MDSTPKKIYKKKYCTESLVFRTDKKHTFVHFGPPFFKKGPITPRIYYLYSAT